MPLGFNITQQASDYEFNYVNSLNHATHVIIDNPKASYALSGKGHRLIYRHTADDNDFYNKWNHKALVDKLHNECSPECLIQIGNEPPVNQLDRLINFTRDSAEYAYNRYGRRIVAYNFSVGNPEINQFYKISRSADEIIRYGAIVGIHEYYDKIPNIEGWLLFRSDRLLIKNEIVITEFGYTKDLNPYIGWKDNISAREYANHIDFSYNEYKKRNIDICMFSLGDWQNFNVGHNDELYKYFIKRFYKNANRYLFIKKIPGTYVNVRTSKDLKSTKNIIGRLRVGDILFGMPEVSFYRVRYGNRLGYISMQGGNVVMV